jgi:DNA-binding transcriptional ArsR family regulator
MLGFSLDEETASRVRSYRYMLYFYNMSRRDKQGKIFKALADDRRREILDMLREGPQTTGELCAWFKKIDRCTVMQHVAVLEDAGLVIAKREGRVRWNYLNVVPVQEIYDRWISRYARPSVELLARLKRDLEG